MTDITRYCSLVRSKDAGPFMLTLDFFFVDDAARQALVPVLSPERIGALYRVDPSGIRPLTRPRIPRSQIAGVPRSQ